MNVGQSAKAFSCHEIEGITNGAPMKAISKGILRSLVRHRIHGSRAKVVMPENIASPVTEEGINLENPCGRSGFNKSPSPLVPRYTGCTYSSVWSLSWALAPTRSNSKMKVERICNFMGRDFANEEISPGILL